MHRVNDGPVGATDMDMFESYLASGGTPSQQRGPLPHGSGQDTNVFGGDRSRIEALRRIHEQEAELNAKIRAADANTQDAVPTNAAGERKPSQPKVPPRGASKAGKKVINQQNWLKSLTGKSRHNDSNAKDAAVSSADRPVEPLTTWNSQPPSQAGPTGNTGFGFTSEQIAEAMNFAKSATRGRTSGASTVNFPKPSTVNVPKSSPVKLPKSSTVNMPKLSVVELPKPSQVKHGTRNPVPASKLLKSYTSQAIDPRTTATTPGPSHATSKTLPPHLRKLQSTKHNTGSVASGVMSNVALTPSQAIAQAFTGISGDDNPAVENQEPQKAMQWAQSMSSHEKESDSTDGKPTTGQTQSSAEFENWDLGHSSIAPRRPSFEQIFQMKENETIESSKHQSPSESNHDRLSNDADPITERTQLPMPIGMLKSLNPYSGPQDDSKVCKVFGEGFTSNIERAIEVISGRLPTRPIKQPSPGKPVVSHPHEKITPPGAQSEPSIPKIITPNAPVESPASIGKSFDQQRNETSILATLGIPVANTLHEQPETSNTSLGHSLKRPIGQPSPNRQARFSTGEQRNEPSLSSVFGIKPSRSPAERKGTASATGSSTFKPPSTTNDHFADLFGLDFSSPGASTSSPTPAAPSFSPATSFFTPKAAAPTFSAAALPFFSSAAPTPSVQTPTKTSRVPTEQVQPPPGLESTHGASQNIFDALLCQPRGNKNPYEMLGQPVSAFGASQNTFDALLSQAAGSTNPYAMLEQPETSYGTSWDTFDSQLSPVPTASSTFDALVTQAGSTELQSSLRGSAVSTLQYHGHDFKPRSIETPKTLSDGNNLQSRFGLPPSEQSPIKARDTNVLHHRAHPMAENNSDELEDSSPAKESGPSSHTVHKKRQSARSALAKAWQERDEIRKRQCATWTLDGARALDYATKSYNDKRHDLASLMASGQLREEDEKTFPYHSTADLSAPKRGEGIRGQK